MQRRILHTRNEACDDQPVHPSWHTYTILPLRDDETNNHSSHDRLLYTASLLPLYICIGPVDSEHMRMNNKDDASVKLVAMGTVKPATMIAVLPQPCKHSKK
jgi:hypothetical protein